MRRDKIKTQSFKAKVYLENNEEISEEFVCDMFRLYPFYKEDTRERNNHFKLEFLNKSNPTGNYEVHKTYKSEQVFKIDVYEYVNNEYFARVTYFGYKSPDFGESEWEIVERICI